MKSHSLICLFFSPLDLSLLPLIDYAKENGFKEVVSEIGPPVFVDGAMIAKELMQRPWRTRNERESERPRRRRSEERREIHRGRRVKEDWRRYE